MADGTARETGLRAEGAGRRAVPSTEAAARGGIARAAAPPRPAARRLSFTEARRLSFTRACWLFSALRVVPSTRPMTSAGSDRPLSSAALAAADSWAWAISTAVASQPRLTQQSRLQTFVLNAANQPVTKHLVQLALLKLAGLREFTKSRQK